MASKTRFTRRLSNTTPRGKNLVKRQMTEEERKLYGLPLTGKAKVEAETEAINEERMLRWKEESK